MSTARRGILTGTALLWVIVTVAGAMLWLSSVVGAESPRAWRALLVSFLFFTPLAVGLSVWPAIIRSCNGTWHAPVERTASAAVGFSVPSVLALVVLWIGSPHWAPWYSKSVHQGIWLNNTFLFARDCLALALFWCLAIWYYRQRRHGEARVAGGVLVAAYALVFSLLGMDLVMALDPHWYSTLAGGYFFISGLYIAITAWGFLAAWKGSTQTDNLHDLGKLMVGFSLMTTYFMYSHLLPIWYEVLPAEVRFVVPRMNFQPWKSVSLVLLGTVYLGPLVMLLLERVKRNRYTLGGIALLILAGMWTERWWLVVPTVAGSAVFGMVELASIATMAGLLALAMIVAGARMPLPGDVERG